MKAENIEQIKEHLQKGGTAWLHCNGASYQVDSVNGTMIRISGGWDDGCYWRTAFDAKLVDYWELAPIKDLGIPKNFWERMDELIPESTGIASVCIHCGYEPADPEDFPDHLRKLHLGQSWTRSEQIEIWNYIMSEKFSG